MVVDLDLFNVLVGGFANHMIWLDVIGLITSISAEREYIMGGKVTKMLMFELTDDDMYSFTYKVCEKIWLIICVIVIRFVDMSHLFDVVGKFSVRHLVAI